MRTLTLTFLLCASVIGQNLLSARITPAFGPAGTTFKLEVYATSSTAISGCAVTTVRRGSPTGPVVSSAAACAAAPRSLGPDSAVSLSWTASDGSGQPLLKGDYFIGVEGGSAGITYFPVRVIDPLDFRPLPVLRLTETTANTMILNLVSSIDPGADYVAAASLQTNDGFLLGGQHAALDLDLGLALSFPMPDPALFRNFHGTLNILGANPAPLRVTLPASAAGLAIPMNVQAVVISATGELRLSNCITHSF